MSHMVSHIRVKYDRCDTCVWSIIPEERREGDVLRGLLVIGHSVPEMRLYLMSIKYMPVLNDNSGGMVPDIL